MPERHPVFRIFKKYQVPLIRSGWLAGLALLGLMLAVSLGIGEIAIANTNAKATGNVNSAQNPPAVTAPATSALAPIAQIQLTADTQHIDLTDKTQFWIDPDVNTSITELIARSSAGVNLFSPSSEKPSHHLGGKVLWIRFELLHEDVKSRWQLELAAATVDDVQLWTQNSSGAWVAQRAGDVVPRTQWPQATRLPVFEIEAQGQREQTVYLRIAHQRAPISAMLNLYRDSRFTAHQQSSHLWLGAFFGLGLVVLAASLSMAALMRERSFLSYAGYLTALLLFLYCNVGLAAYYLWPNSPVLADRSIFISACLTASLGPWFVRQILQPVTRLRLLNWVMYALFFIMAVMAVVEAFAPTLWSYRLVNFFTLAAVLLVYTFVWFAWERGDNTTRWVAIGFLPVAFGALPLILRNMGLMANNSLTQYSLLIASAIEMPMLLYALLQRSAIRRDSAMRAVGLPAHDALTGLSNMRVFLAQLHGVISRALRYKQSYGLILIDLSNEAWFAKEHGREVADRALILLGARLSERAREIDTLARIDHAQFALLIEGPCTAREMASTSARISASALKPSEALPVGATLKLQITSALLPMTNESIHHTIAQDDANAVLGALIQQAEDLNKNSRKTIHTIGF